MAPARRTQACAGHASAYGAATRPQSALEPGLPVGCYSDGRRFRILPIVDDFTRECLALVPDRSLPGLRVVRELNAHIAARGRPAMCVSDNGTELTGMAILRWGTGRASRMALHRAPQQNAFIESFNGRLRDEMLNETLFASLNHVRRMKRGAQVIHPVCRADGSAMIQGLRRCRTFDVGKVKRKRDSR